MEKLDLLPNNGLERIFQRLDIIVDKIHQHAVEPLLSRDIERRTGGGTGPSFNLTDDYILKRIIRNRGGIEGHFP